MLQFIMCRAINDGFTPPPFAIRHMASCDKNCRIFCVPSIKCQSILYFLWCSKCYFCKMVRKYQFIVYFLWGTFKKKKLWLIVGKDKFSHFTFQLLFGFSSKQMKVIVTSKWDRVAFRKILIENIFFFKSHIFTRVLSWLKIVLY